LKNVLYCNFFVQKRKVIFTAGRFVQNILDLV
jgi:hypothetical protein